MAHVIVDLGSDEILQVIKTPESNEATLFNGRYALPIPPGASFEITGSSYIFPQDGSDVASELAGALLAQYPMYENIVYNFLLDETDIADLDLVATGPSGAITRAQVGRAVGPAPIGQAPNTTALLPLNDNVVPNRPGMLVTDTIDIGPVTGGAGADEFLVWWYFWDFDTTDDINADFGLFAGTNTPAYRQLFEVDQEQSDLQVYISHDDGATWTAIGLLEPTDLITFDTSVRLAFRWTGSDKIYLGAYAIMF